MERETQYLLRLLGAFLCGREPETAEGIDWNRLLELARRHSVTGIVGYLGNTWHLCGDPEKKRVLRALCLSTMGLYARRAAAAEELEKALSHAGIDHILMKGYVLRDCYPVPELRTFNDIDVVIRREDRQRSHALMLELGFQTHTDWEPVYSYFRGEELYELHTDIMEIDVSRTGGQQRYFQTMWDHAAAAEPHSFRFTPEFHFLYLLTHLAKHVHGAGAGIRMYLDLAAFVRCYGGHTDWSRVCRELEALKLRRFAEVVLTGAGQWFGVELPWDCGPVEPVVLEELLRFTLEAGTFGKQEDAALTGLKQTDGDSPASRLKHLLRRSFPAAETIQTRYTYLQDRPWLLPVAWVHRLVKTRQSLGAHAREAGGILCADGGELQRLKRLMREIGL